MSAADVEVVRRFNDPYEGRDVMPVLRELLERLGPDPDSEEVLAVWAEDPMFRHAHPEIEWDTTGVGMGAAAVKGPSEMSDFWADWTGAWETYTYRTVGYRDLGDWVLTETEVEATGPDRIEVAMRAFQIWKVEEDKVKAVRVFLSEADALEAAAA